MRRFLPFMLAAILLVIATFEFVILFGTGIAIDFAKRDAPYTVAQAIISGFEAFLAILLFWRFNIARVMLLWVMPFVAIGIPLIYMNIDRVGVLYWTNFIKLAWYIAFAIVYTRPALVYSFKNSY